jgi:hypothetical protein
MTAYMQQQVAASASSDMSQQWMLRADGSQEPSFVLRGRTMARCVLLNGTFGAANVTGAWALQHGAWLHGLYNTWGAPCMGRWPHTMLDAPHACYHICHPADLYSWCCVAGTPMLVPSFSCTSITGKLMLLRLLFPCTLCMYLMHPLIT